MKKIVKLLLIACLLSLAPTVWTFADVSDTDHVPAYFTDYYVIIESPGDGIDLYASPNALDSRLNTEPIANGTILHVEGEKTDDAGNLFGYVTYHSMKGYIPLEYTRIVSAEEALQSQVNESSMNLVNYDAEANGKAGSVAMYDGPSDQFDLIEGSTAIPNGEVLHVSAEVENSEGDDWVQAVHNGVTGWVPQSQIITPSPTPTITNTPTPTPISTNTPTPVPTSTPVPTVTSTSTPVPTSTPTPAATNTSTLEPTSTDTQTPDDTNTPVPTSSPAETPAEVTSGEVPDVSGEPDDSGSDFSATEAPDEESERAASAGEQTRNTSIPPILIAVAVAMVCLLIVLLIALKKKNE